MDIFLLGFWVYSSLGVQKIAIVNMEIEVSLEFLTGRMTSRAAKARQKLKNFFNVFGWLLLCPIV